MFQKDAFILKFYSYQTLFLIVIILVILFHVTRNTIFFTQTFKIKLYSLNIWKDKHALI